MPSPDIYQEERILTPLQQTWRRYRRNSMAMFSLWVLGGLLVCALLAPWLSPHGAHEQFLDHLLQPPAWEPNGQLDFFLGTDDLGRDMLSRLLLGLRTTLGTALIAVVLALILGASLGLVAAFARGLKSSILHHLLDSILSIPSLLLVLLFIALLGPGLTNVLLAMWLAQMPQFVRTTYQRAHIELQKEYVLAIRLDGANNWRTLRYAVLPNITPDLIGQITRSISISVLDISAIGFLGLGLDVPIPELGAMLSSSINLVFMAPWTVFQPGLTILATVLVINIVGENLQQAFQMEGE